MKNDFNYKWSKIFASKRFKREDGFVLLAPIEQHELLEDAESLVKKLTLTDVSKPLNVFLVGDNVLFGHKKAKVIWTSVRYVDIQLINGTMYQGVPVSVIRHP